MLATLLGYAFTASISIALAMLIIAIIWGRKEIANELKSVSKYTWTLLACIIIVFLIIAIFYTTAFEELYFDENIYQGIAINILKHGTMLWCQAGTGFLNSCYINAIYHDPAGWSYFLAIAFAVFGIGITTAYGSELFIGTISLLFFFLFAYLLTKRQDFALVSTGILSLIPGLFIWSRTQADPDLPFMTFSILTFFFFVLFMRARGKKTFAMFISSLVITLYMRTEAILLLGIFLVLYLLYGNGYKSVRKRIKATVEHLNTDTSTTALLLLFVLLIIPQVIYIAYEAANPSYGQASNQSVISISNFVQNFPQNVEFILGHYNGAINFPVIFPPGVFLLTLLGIALLAFEKEEKVEILSTTIIWFLTYFLFYSSFYAGSATFGVDSRFMLQTYPSLSLLAGIAIVLLVEDVLKLGGFILKKIKHIEFKVKKWYIIISILVVFAACIVYPFIRLSPEIRLPPSEMPQQNIIAPTIEFFYSNYSKVPSNCLVFSFTPDIWYEVGRASLQIGYLNSTNSTIVNLEKRFSCFVLDYGYWCMVPPYNSTLCAYDKNAYRTITLSEGSIPYTVKHPAFYLIENYVP
ncbi:MAG: hypothetical protein ACP5HW_02830 [Candidatus Micrarchaeia archaeon]